MAYVSSYEVEVRSYELDVYNHVNNAVYFRYLESARIQYLSDLGWDDFEADIVPVLGEVKAKFINPVVYPDRLAVGTQPLVQRDHRRGLAAGGQDQHCQGEGALHGPGGWPGAAKMSSPLEVRPARPNITVGWSIISRRSTRSKPRWPSGAAAWRAA